MSFFNSYSGICCPLGSLADEARVNAGNAPSDTQFVAINKTIAKYELRLIYDN